MFRRPTPFLLLGFAIILAAVAVFSWYTLRQMNGLRRLQTETIDRNRRDSLQMLRMQSNLNSLAQTMRDMLDGSEPYPLTGYQPQWQRIRRDLDDAVRVERRSAPASRTAPQQQQLETALTVFDEISSRMFTLAGAGKDAEARQMLRTVVQQQHAAVAATIARFLVQNNEAEEQATAAIQQIYANVERNLYRFLAAVLLAIAVTSLTLALYNRRLFADLAELSQQKTTLARQLISVQEETFRSLSRELHDEFGQILTAIGALLSRAGRKHVAPDTPLQAALQEVQGIVQSALDRIRGLSQMLHPAVLDDYGLDKTLEWYLPMFARQTGLAIHFDKQGDAAHVPSKAAIHVYRIIQEALNNVARHAQTPAAWVRVQYQPARLLVEVEDHGAGIPAEPKRVGLGLVAMRERAELLGGCLELRSPLDGGTLVSLDVPLLSHAQDSSVAGG